MFVCIPDIRLRPPNRRRAVRPSRIDAATKRIERSIRLGRWTHRTPSPSSDVARAFSEWYGVRQTVYIYNTIRYNWWYTRHSRLVASTLNINYSTIRFIIVLVYSI